MARIDETVGSGIGGVVKIPFLKSTRSLRKGGFDRQSLSGVRAHLQILAQVATQLTLSYKVDRRQFGTGLQSQQGLGERTPQGTKSAQVL